MTYGLFEAAETDGLDRQTREAAAERDLNAAISDVTERFGSFLRSAADKSEFETRVALVKPEMMKVVEAHLMPVSGVMRRVVGSQRPPHCSGKNGQQRAASRKTADFDEATDAVRGWLQSNGESINYSTSDMALEQLQNRIVSDLGNSYNQRDLEDAVRMLGQMTASREAAIDDAEELIPEGNFDGYLDEVDDGAEGKVDHLFHPADHAAGRKTAAGWTQRGSGEDYFFKSGDIEAQLTPDRTEGWIGTVLQDGWEMFVAYGDAGEVREQVEGWLAENADIHIDASRKEAGVGDWSVNDSEASFSYQLDSGAWLFCDVNKRGSTFEWVADSEDHGTERGDASSMDAAIGECETAATALIGSDPFMYASVKTADDQTLYSPDSMPPVESDSPTVQIETGEALNDAGFDRLEAGVNKTADVEELADDFIDWCERSLHRDPYVDNQVLKELRQFLVSRGEVGEYDGVLDELASSGIGGHPDSPAFTGSRDKTADQWDWQAGGGSSVNDRFMDWLDAHNVPEEGVSDVAMKQHIKDFGDDNPDVKPSDLSSLTTSYTVGSVKQSYDDFYDYGGPGYEDTSTPAADGWEQNYEASQQEWHNGRASIVFNESLGAFYSRDAQGNEGGPYDSLETAKSFTRTSAKAKTAGGYGDGYGMGGSSQDATDFAVAEYLRWAEASGMNPADEMSLEAYNGNDEISQDDYNDIWDWIETKTGKPLYNGKRKTAGGFTSEELHNMATWARSYGLISEEKLFTISDEEVIAIIKKDYPGGLVGWSDEAASGEYLDNAAADYEMGRGL